MNSQQNNQQHIIIDQLLHEINQQIKAPIMFYDNLLILIQNYSQMKKKYIKQQKLNKFKDILIQNIIEFFQSNENKLLNKLNDLEDINIQYIEQYLYAKQKSIIKFQNQSRGINSKVKINFNSKKARQCTINDILNNNNQKQISFIDIKKTQSIFKSNQWFKLLNLSQCKLKQIQDQYQLSCQIKNQHIISHKLCQVVIQLLNKYIFKVQSLNVQNNQCHSIFKININNLIQLKKQQISQNSLLRNNQLLKKDLDRLQQLRIDIIKFQNQFIKIKGQLSLESLAYILFNKSQIQRRISNELAQQQRQKNCLKHNQKSMFNELCNQLQKILKVQHFKQSSINLTCENPLIQTLITQIQQLKQKQQKKITRLKSLAQYLSNLRSSHKNSLQTIQSLKGQNYLLNKRQQQLLVIQQKYNYFLQNNDFKDNPISNMGLKKSVCLNQTRQRVYFQEQKLIFQQTIIKKDRLYQLRTQELKQAQANIQYFQTNVKSLMANPHFADYYKHDLTDYQRLSFNQLVDRILQTIKSSISKPQNEINYQELMQKLKNKEQIATKRLQLACQQYTEKLQQVEQQVKLSQLQKQSLKCTLSTLHRQSSKQKAQLDKLHLKNKQLQMQNSKIEQILKSILDMEINYLMGYINYTKLIDIMDAVVGEIKGCLKYREKERERDQKESPLIDYRFSGLSAVSNDFSFSKLHKQSYFDYFNEDSDIDEQSQVISKLSSQDQVTPPSRPSYSINTQKRTLGIMDINQRLTMAQQEQSMVNYISPVSVRMPIQPQDQYIKSLQTHLITLKQRIPPNDKQNQFQTKQIYDKYKQVNKCLEAAEKGIRDQEIQYQRFLKSLKEQGVMQCQGQIQRKLFYLEKTIKQQNQLIQKQRIQFETTISNQVLESEKTMASLIKNLNRSMSLPLQNNYIT